MDEREVERRLRTALEHAAPDDLEAVRARCGAQQSPDVIPISQAKKRPTRRMAPMLIAACLVLAVIGGVVGGRFLGGGTADPGPAVAAVASVVSLDVNPSVRLDVSAEEVVLAAQPINDDAGNILDGMDLAGTDLNVAVNAIVGSLLKHGYVDELANSVLVSVEDEDAARGAALEEKLAGEIAQVLESASIHGAILSQTFSRDAALEQKAAEYGISQGKAALIQSLVEGSDHLTFESLVGLSINELNLLVNSTAVQGTSAPEQGGQTVAQQSAITSTGAASQNGYIGPDAAQKIALDHAGLTADGVIWMEADFDYEDGRMVYEVEFVADGAEYEYDIDAVTGEIMKFEREGGYAPVTGGGTGTGTGAGSMADIGQEAAKAAALAHAGVSEGDTRGLVVKRDFDDGLLKYEIEFWAGTTEYEYDVAAADGSILKSKREDHPNALPADQAIGREAARNAALAHAGLSVNDVWELEVDEELDDRYPHYQVEFKSGGYEYEYEIDAATGAVLWSERDWD